MSAWLQIILGLERGRVFEIAEGRTSVAGRDSKSEIPLVHDTVSRRHTLLRATAGTLVVSDAGSTNGTFLNGRRVRREAHVSAGDMILIGAFLLRAHESAPGELPPNTWLDGAYRPETGPRNAVIAFDFRGSLAHIPVPAVLRYVTTLKKSGFFVLTKPEREARIDLMRGRIRGVVIDGERCEDGRAGLLSLLDWVGTFDLDRARDLPAAEPEESMLALDDVLPPVD